MPRNSDLYRCRVCGLKLEDPPWGLDGETPLYEYCPCCGVEFGYQDASALGARTFREKWLASGAEWSEPKEKPPDWDLVKQLEHVPEAFR
jgi:hypothetical protein